MNEVLVLGLALIGAVAVFGWILWVSTSIGDVDGLSRGLDRTRQEMWGEFNKQQTDIAMLEQRIIELEKGKKK